MRKINCTVNSYEDDSAVGLLERPALIGGESGGGISEDADGWHPSVFDGRGGGSASNLSVFVREVTSFRTSGIKFGK